MEKEILSVLTQINKRLDGIDGRLDGMDQKIDDLRGEMFLFEQEYGTKNDAIFDAVTLELDQNIEKSEKIRKLDGRMERNY